MTKACQLMGEHGSESLGIQSRHEPRSSKRRPSPQLVAMRWASVGVPILCGDVANGKTLSFDNKAPAEGDVFAAIAESVFL